MKRMKTFFKYVIWIVLFWILTDVLIYFGINYQDRYQKIDYPELMDEVIDEVDAKTEENELVQMFENKE